MRRPNLEDVDVDGSCPLIKAALGDAASLNTSRGRRASACPLIKAALGDAAVAFALRRKMLLSCPLIKAALGDAANPVRRASNDDQSVH